MRRGDFEAAWRLGDDAPASARGVRQPQHHQRIWDGRPIDGRRVLVRCYHGLGDTIQFARYLPLLAARAASVVVLAQPAALSLLATMHPRVELLPLQDGVPDVAYDVDVEIMELPWVFHSTLDTLPAVVPYFRVEPGLRAIAGRLRLGVVWRGGGWDAARDVPAELMAPFARIPGVSAVALVDRPTTEERAAWAGRFAFPEPLLPLARLVAGLNLVVTVDTMCAHLAGALAVPVWTLLTHDADWRWMAGRADCAWYPTMRVFRQPAPGRWDVAVAAVEQALRTRAEAFVGSAVAAASMLRDHTWRPAIPS